MAVFESKQRPPEPETKQLRGALESFRDMGGGGAEEAGEAAIQLHEATRDLLDVLRSVLHMEAMKPEERTMLLRRIRALVTTGEEIPSE